MNYKELNKILTEHKHWLNEEGGGRAYLGYTDLSYMGLFKANLRGASLIEANLSGSDVRVANLSETDARRANLSEADLRGSDLREADLRYSDLSGANLKKADLRGAVLSGVKGILSPINYMKSNFERTEDGYIVYKTFGCIYASPIEWDIKIGSIIEEVVNPNRTDECGCGINVAPLEWVTSHCSGQIYKLLIKWEWLPGVVVPYNTDGKIRCEKAMIIDVLPNK